MKISTAPWKAKKSAKTVAPKQEKPIRWPVTEANRQQSIWAVNNSLELDIRRLLPLLQTAKKIQHRENALMHACKLHENNVSLNAWSKTPTSAHHSAPKRVKMLARSGHALA